MNNLLRLYTYYILTGGGVTEYSLLADDLAGEGGSSVDVNSLQWHAFPAEWLVDWVVPGTFKAGVYTNCYLYAQDGASQESNHIYVEVHDLSAS